MSIFSNAISPVSYNEHVRLEAITFLFVFIIKHHRRTGFFQVFIFIQADKRTVQGPEVFSSAHVNLHVRGLLVAVVCVVIINHLRRYIFNDKYTLVRPRRAYFVCKWEAYKRRR